VEFQTLADLPSVFWVFLFSLARELLFIGCLNIALRICSLYVAKPVEPFYLIMFVIVSFALSLLLMSSNLNLSDCLFSTIAQKESFSKTSSL